MLRPDDLPEYPLDAGVFTPLEPGEIPAAEMRLQVMGRPFDLGALPLMAQIGGQLVHTLTIGPQGNGFDGFLARKPEPGDRLFLGYGRPDMFRTNIVFEEETPALICRSFQEMLAAEGTFTVPVEVVDRSSSSFVLWLQRSLNRVGGAMIVEDGILGSKTRGALSAFQGASGLRTDGFVSAAVEKALVAAGADLPPGVFAGPFPGPFAKRTPDRTTPCPGAPVEILDSFEFDRSDLTSQHRIQLERVGNLVIASWGTATPVHLACLEGHTDTSGSRQHNLGLGERRARSAAEGLRSALESQCGGVSSQIGIWQTSAGEERPLSTEGSATGRARNRRVEIYLNTQWKP